MKKVASFSQILIFFSCFLTISPLIFAQNTTLVGQLSFSDEASDIWGYTDSNTGKEYALVGLYSGMSIVDVSQPSDPKQVFFASGASSTWRDIKTWQQWAYITNESWGGLQILDLSQLPNVPTNSFWTGGTFQNQTIEMQAAHNIFIDENGIGYICGHDFGGGILMIDIAANPLDPPIIGRYDAAYVHDLFVRGDTMWTAEIYNGYFAIIDIQNKANPITLATKQTPREFTHNIWPNSNGTAVFTTDERAAAPIAAYDVSNITDISEVDRYRSYNNQETIPHNVFVKDNFIITSYYRDGFTVADATYPNNIIEVAQYDTSPNFEGGGFNGCWGVYPYLPSGLVLASDIENGLYVIKVDYEKACYLEGIVSNELTGDILAGVEVKITAEEQSLTYSDLSGKYATGIAQSGNYSVRLYKEGYEVKVINNINLTNSDITALNVALRPLAAFSIDVKVSENLSSMPIVSTQIFAISTTDTLMVETGSDGLATFDLFYEENYNITVGKWGYITQQLDNQAFNANINQINIQLEKGYQDDFFFDFGWSVESTAIEGIWERAEPNAAFYGTIVANPASDISDDFGEKCYVTGKKSSLNNNVNDGQTILSSPIFDLSNYTNPILSYNTWFYTQHTDSLLIKLNNGIETKTIQTITNASLQNSWQKQEIIINNQLILTENMQLILETADRATSPSILNTAFDGFQVTDNEAIIALPTANFTSNKTSGCNPLTIEFNNNSSGIVDNILWTFENGNPSNSTLQKPIVTFEGVGNFNVTLTAYNEAGNNSISNTVTVYESPPLNAFLSQDEICIGKSINLLVFNPQQNTSYNWSAPDFNAEGATITFTPTESTTFSLLATDENGCQSSKNLFVNVLEKPVFSIKSNNSICLGDTITLEIENPTDDYTYIWEGSQLLQNTGLSVQAIPQNNQTYTVTATNSQNCTEKQSITTFVSTPASVSLTASKESICEGEVVQLNAVAPNALSYTWYANGQLINDITDKIEINLIENTIFKVVIQDDNGCQNFAEKNITIDTSNQPVADFNTTNQAICLGGEIALQNNAQNAESFLWEIVYEADQESINLTEANPTVVLDKAGIYTIILTVKGCGTTENTMIKENFIVVNPLPTIDFSNSNNEACLGESITLVNNNNQQTSIWLDENGLILSQENEFSFLLEKNMTLTLLATDLQGCSNQTIIPININTSNNPIANFAVNNTIFCIDESLIINNLSQNIENNIWILRNIETNMEQVFEENEPQIILNEAGTFQLNLRVEGCGNTADSLLLSENIIVNDRPFLEVENEEISLCLNEIKTLNIITNGNVSSYEWTFNKNDLIIGTSESLEMDETGLYNIKIVDNNGCINEKIITVLPQTNISMANFEVLQESICIGNRIPLSNLSENTNDFEWLFSTENETFTATEGTPNITAQVAGTYDVQLIAKGCGVDTLLLENAFTVYQEPEVKLDFDNYLCLGESLNLDNQVVIINDSGLNLSFDWSGEDINNGIFTPSQAGKYTIELETSNEFACNSSTSGTIEIKNCTNVADVKNTTIKLYPNPNNGIFKLVFDNDFGKENKLKIFNILGDLIFEKELLLNQNSFTKNVNLNHLIKGLYYISLSNKKGETIFVEKVIIK